MLVQVLPLPQGLLAHWSLARTSTSQLSPLSPGAQKQVYGEGPVAGEQAPPFWQGLGLQGSPGPRQSGPEKPTAQVRPQTPAAQVAVPFGLAGQTVPHPPQFFRSWLTWTSQALARSPSQSAKPDGQPAALSQLAPIQPVGHLQA